MIRSSLMAQGRTNSELLVMLRHDARVPLHRQIETSIREAIRAGRLTRGSSLPPTRVLAADLGVSRGVVVEAYQQLTAEGYLASRAGGYTQVAAGPAVAAASPGPAGEPKPAIDLSYGRADVSSFPRAAWLRSIRSALTDAPNEVFGYLTGRGVPQLRTALADYLNRVRGTVADPDHMVICTGYGQGVTLLVSVLAAGGARRLALEDPSSRDDALPAARAAGLEVVGIPVDGDDRHLRRMRPVYRRRRDALLAALARHLPWLEPAGVSAGLHLLTWLPPRLDEATVVGAARRAGVGLDAVGPYRITHPGPGGLIFGYATVSERAIAEGVARLAQVIGEL